MINSTFLRIGTEAFDSYPSFCRLSSGTNVAVVNIPAKGFSKLSYKSSTTSVGAQQFGPLRLLVRDIAGLFFYERDIDVQSSVEVTPKGDVIPRGALAGLALSTYGGAVTSRRKGEGFDFADIRKYQVGDPYKRIEWSSTARSRQLMVRETSLETQLNIMVALDITETMAYGEAGQTQTVTREGCRVACEVSGRQGGLDGADLDGRNRLHPSHPPCTWTRAGHQDTSDFERVDFRTQRLSGGRLRCQKGNRIWTHQGESPLPHNN